MFFFAKRHHGKPAQSFPVNKYWFFHFATQPRPHSILTTSNYLGCIPLAFASLSDNPKQPLHFASRPEVRRVTKQHVLRTDSLNGSLFEDCEKVLVRFTLFPQELCSQSPGCFVGQA